MATEADKTAPIPPPSEGPSQMEKKIDVLGTNMSDLQTAMRELITEVRDLKGKVENSNTISASNTKRIVRLETDLSVTKRNMMEKMMEMEDRQRRKNLVFKGIPNEVKRENLIECIKDWITKAGYPIDRRDLDRAHRLYRRRNRNKDSPLDVIVLFSRESVAEEVWRFARTHPGERLGDEEIRVFRDFSNMTLKTRALLRPITSRLTEAGIRYSWGVTSTILVFKDGQKWQAKNLREGASLLRALGLDAEGVISDHEEGEDQDGDSDSETEETAREEESGEAASARAPSPYERQIERAKRREGWRRRQKQYNKEATEARLGTLRERKK